MSSSLKRRNYSKTTHAYEAENFSSQGMEQCYKNITARHSKARDAVLWSFEQEKFYNVCKQKVTIRKAVEDLALSVPNDIIDCIIDLQLTETQVYIEYKSTQIQNQVKKRNDITDFPLHICRNICLFSGGYCWDGNFWALTWDKCPLHRYTNFDRIVFYCGYQDVIYCKSDEYCCGNRYFVEIKIDSKKDNMWLGVVWSDENNWSRRRGENKIAYHGGRYRSTQRMIAEFMDKFADVYESITSNENIDDNNNNKLELETNIIAVSDELQSRPSSLWDGGLGGIHGRNKIESEALPYYGSGDVVGILVDKVEGIVYFYKNSVLVWFIGVSAISKEKCKIFGSTDTADDTLIYDRILWNDIREKDLMLQVKQLRQNTPSVDTFSDIMPNF